MLEYFIAKRKELILNKIKESKSYNVGIEASEESIQKLLKFNELNPVILDFITKFNEKYPDYNFLLMKNLKDLHIYINHYEEGVLRGEFYKNRIYLDISEGLDYDPNDEKLKNILYHGLLNTSTYDSKKDSYSTGLRKFVANRFVGYKLNEGYTDLLINRHFSDRKRINSNIKFAENVERLIGRNKLKECYFTGNLYSVITSLGKYVEDPLQFMMDVDDEKINPNEVLSKIEKKKSKTITKR